MGSGQVVLLEAVVTGADARYLFLRPISRVEHTPELGHCPDISHIYFSALYTM